MKESGTMHSGCPGSMMHTLNPVVSSPSIDVSSQLTSWPIQIKLAPINAPFFQHAKLFNSCGLYSLCLCQFSSGIYEK